MQETQLGWIVAGSTLAREDINKTSTVALCTSLSKLEEQVSKFWRTEEIGSKTVFTLEEKACHEHFENTVQRDEKGRFVVQLPFRDKALKLGDSKPTATRRFHGIEKRLLSSPRFKIEYSKFMKEYEDLEHMTKVEPCSNSNIKESYYIPHHAVWREDSVTTKLRVVFDASSKTTSGVSLNDVLLKGPCIQEDLINLLTRFRKHRYAMTADISKMYRRIWVAPNHRTFQQIIWRPNPDQELHQFQLNTITYGTVPASFLATACLHRLADEESNVYPDACNAIKQDFYMDDYLGGTESLQEAIKLRDDIIEVLLKGGFELRKWTASDPTLLTGLANKENDPTLILDLSENSAKILGLRWDPSGDVFKYKVKLSERKSIVTKRQILSEIATIFDPLGLISPVVIKAKIKMQRLWAMGIGWDETLPEETMLDWYNFRESLLLLNNLHIPRCIVIPGQIIDVQIHGFSDASIEAFGACLYLITTNNEGKRSSRLICAKSRVAPLKSISLPRLELCGAVLLARLADKIIAKLKMNISQRTFWTDSSIVLAWISSPSAQWKTFVAHRVGEIQEITSISEWARVDTKDNPADIISLGREPHMIVNDSFWWEGPNWFQCDSSKWPHINKNQIDFNTVEERRTISLLTSREPKLSFLSRYSSWSKLLRIVALCLRFIYNTSHPKEKKTGPLLPYDLNDAINGVIRFIQGENWSSEISDLKKNGQCSPKSNIFRLRPYLDENNILRVGGRLKNASQLDQFQKNPMLVPPNSPIVYLLFQDAHDILLHGGPQLMLAHVRQRFWPINGRNIARKVSSKCVRCFRLKPTIFQPIMGNFQKQRIEPSRPFSVCSVDFAGPLMIKTSLRRNATLSKGYICVFICFATKAVHIELVGDLTSASFISALKRFCDRRGKCTDIYSDNAKNFVGANRQLQELSNLIHTKEHQSKLQNVLSESGIRWHFIPPRSPHFGGLWESAIKSIKHHLFRTLGNANFTYEELNTILIRVEACLNSRPLVPLSSDPSDLAPLTPGHFLIGDALTALPKTDVSLVPTNRLTRWRRVMQVSQQIWSRWSREYLTQLQERKRWSVNKGPRIKIGSIVLVKDDNSPPLHWKLGLVQALHVDVDGDGIPRVATVKTPSGIYRRAISCYLLYIVLSQFIIMSETNMNDELVLLERVFFRLGLADTDTQLSACINNFLVPVLLKLSSPHESVKNKVVELLTHITRVIKQSPGISLPVDQLVMLLATSTNNFVLNFTMVFVKTSFGRIDNNKKVELIPSLINSTANKSIIHQESILFLIIGTLNKSNFQEASKGVKVIEQHSKLKTVLFQFMLDILLIPYKWTSPNEVSVPGLNVQSLNRLRTNIPLIFTDADYHEQVKLGILGLISANIFESQSVLIHTVVAAADPRYLVANSGENELRKITCEIDWTKSSTMMPLYTLFLGTSLNKQEAANKKEPACVRLRLKILPCLCFSKGEESIIWPQCLQIIFDCWNGQITNHRIKSLALQFTQIIIQQKPAKILLQATPVLLNSGLLKLLKTPELDLNAKQMTFTLIGLLISKVPTSVKEDLVLLNSFVDALIKETSSDLKGSIRSCLISMCSAYSESSKLNEILNMIAHYCKMSDNLLKQVTTHYLSCLFPADDAKSRLLLIMSHSSSIGDSDLKKILYSVDEAGNLVGKNENALLLPRFPDMVMTVVDSNQQLDSSVLLDIAEFLNHCLIFSAGLPVTYNTLYHPSEHTPDICKYLSKVYQSDAKIIDHYFKLMMQLLQIKPSVIPLNNILACVAALPKELKNQYTKDLNIIQKLFVSSNEDMRRISGILYGIILSAVDETISEKRIKELISSLMDKNRSKSLDLFASLYALSSLQEYQYYNNTNCPPLVGEDILTSLVTLLDDTSPLIVGAACDVIGAMGRLYPLPIEESKKSSLVKKLLSISFNSSTLSKIRNKAIKCTGLICVGETSSRSKDIIKEYLNNTKYTKDIEIHLSIGDSISCAILGPRSKMSRNFWTCTEDEFKKKSVSDLSIDECEKLADYFLNSILEKVESEEHPNSKQACCVWMFNVLEECNILTSVNQKLARIQTAYVALLAEKNNYIRDIASKALINVYKYEADDRKEPILKLLIKQLSEYMAIGNSGKESSGGILSTYKELCSLVIDLNRPKLIYKFIQLANYDKKKESKSKLEIDDQLNEQLPFIIPRLYRYQYDPTPVVQTSMSAIWSYLVSDTRFTVDKYHKEIYVDLVKNITCPDWRVRISVCQAIPSFLQYTGDKIFTKCLDLTIEAWKQLIRVMDDIHEGTRTAAISTAKTLSKLCVNECTSNTILLQLLLPLILERGLYHTESSIRAISMDMISQLIVNCGNKLKGDLAKLIIALLRGADKVETPTMSMLSVMSGANPNTQELIDSQRAASARTLSSSDVLSKSLLHIDETVLQDLIPLLQDLLTTNIGLPTKVATSHFISLLITQKQLQVNSKFLEKMLKSLMKGITDRNATIRKSYASTIAVITTVAKETTVNKLLQSLTNVYTENEDESIRQTVGYALKGISQCEKPDLYLANIIPLVFFAIHKKETNNDAVLIVSNHDIWKELWEDNVHNTEGVLLRYLDSVYGFLDIAIKSPSWAMKAQAARSIGDAANKLGRQLNEEHRNKFIETIKTGLAGRTWDGKEFLLEALLQLNLSSSDLAETRKNEEIVELVFNECKKENVNYRMVALKTLGELLEKLKIDRFAQTYQLVMHIIQKSTEDSDDDDDQSQNLKLKESLFSLVGKAWPQTLATQVEFGETVAAQCADHLKNNTRQLQLAIMSTLLKVIERLAFAQLYANHKQQLKYILSHVKITLHFSFGVPKNISLRKLSLEVYILVITNLKDLRATEELESFISLFNEFSMNFISDESPEVKLLLQKIKESME